MRWQLLAFIGVCAVSTGCSSLSKEGGVFEDRSQAYAKASALDLPVSSKGLDYTIDVLYPIPPTSANQTNNAPLLLATPRAMSTRMVLEQDAIVLLKSKTLDRVLFKSPYAAQLDQAILDSLDRRQINRQDQMTTDHWHSINKSLQNSSSLNEKYQLSTITHWLDASKIGLETPGFFQRLFGAEQLQHQYVYLVSTANQALMEQESLQGGEVQLFVGHRTKSKQQGNISAWRFSAVADESLGLEVMNIVDDIKREIVLSVAETSNDIKVVFSLDGNGLASLSIDERFAVAWESLIKAIPRSQWAIVDLDRSKSMVYLKVKNDSVLQDLKVTTFQLNLAIGPQVMILSVELEDEKPATLEVGRHVLRLLEKKMTAKK